VIYALCKIFVLRKSRPQFTKFGECQLARPLTVPFSLHCNKKCARYPLSKICAPRKSGPKFKIGDNSICTNTPHRAKFHRARSNDVRYKKFLHHYFGARGDPLCQCSPMWMTTYSNNPSIKLPNFVIGATWYIRLNLCFLRPTGVHKPNGKSMVQTGHARACPFP